MDKILHKLCGTRHWSTETCPFLKNNKPASKQPIKNRQEANAIALECAESTKKAVTEIKADKRKTGQKFDKVAYQREYMRKKRAEAKK